MAIDEEPDREIMHRRRCGKASIELIASKPTVYSYFVPYCLT